MKRNAIGNKIIIWVAVILISVVILLPVYWIVLSSILPKKLIFTFPIHYIPRQPSINNYIALFKVLDMARLFKNSVITTVLGVGGAVLFSIMGGYALARIKFRGSSLVMGLLLLSTILPATAVLVPLFELFRSLGMIDNVWGLSLLYMNAPIPFGVWIMYNFLNQVPYSIEESARIDGAGFIKILFWILVPVLQPAIITLVICNFVGAWNEFTTPLIFAGNKASTLPVGFVQLSGSGMYSIPWDTMSALGVLLIIPVLILAAVFEKRIVQGLISGSIKG